MCTRLENPAFGSVRLTGTTIGSRANYSCNSGYVLAGDRVRVCRQDGEWSGEAPTCTRRKYRFLVLFCVCHKSMHLAILGS